MRDCTGQSCKGHNKDARSNCCFQLISEHAGQHQKQHHATACSDKSTDKSNHNTAENRLLDFLFFWFVCLYFFRRHDRTDDKFQSDKQCHHFRKSAHGSIWHKRRYEAADQCKNQNRYQHNHAVADINVFILFISPGTYSWCQHIRCQRNANRLISRHV